MIKIDTQAPHVACAHKPPPGLYTTGWNESYPRLQPLTIAELLKDRGVAYPAWSANSTYKSAPRTQAQAETILTRSVTRRLLQTTAVLVVTYYNPPHH